MSKITPKTSVLGTVSTIDDRRHLYAERLRAEIPASWSVLNIGDLCTIRTGKLDVNQADEGGRYPFFTCAERIYQIHTYAFEAEAILVAGNGFFNVKYYKGKFNAYQRTYVLSEIKTLGKYLYYYVDYRLRDITGESRGSTISYIRLGDLRDYPVAVAPPDQQKHIVAEIEKQFSRLDEAVAPLKRTKANLKRYKASVLKAAVEGKLTEDWRDVHKDKHGPGSQLLERMLTRTCVEWSVNEKCEKPESISLNELPPVPESWCYCSAETICTELFLGLTSKVDYVDEGGVPLVRARDISGGHLSFTEVRCISQKQHQELTKYRKAKKGDVLVSKSGSLGTCALVEVDREFSIYESIICIRTFGEFLLPTFLLWMLRSRSVQARMLGEKVGSTVGHLNLNSFRKLVIPVPPLAEQYLIVAEVERRLSVIDELEATVEANLTRADRLRQSILCQAFSGRLSS
ncbi:MAG: restriction endonuclease subunit S [Nitrospira sp.]